MELFLFPLVCLASISRGNKEKEAEDERKQTFCLSWLFIVSLSVQQNFLAIRLLWYSREKSLGKLFFLHFESSILEILEIY